MSLGERLIKNNEYDKGYAQALSDAAKVAEQYILDLEGRDRLCCFGLSKEIETEIKALLPKGTK